MATQAYPGVLADSTRTVVLDLARPAATQRRAARVLRPVDGWETQAACRFVVTGPAADVFFSPDGEANPNTLDRQRRAKRICQRCPVREPCLAEALASREPQGVWGGMTAHERRGLLATEGVRLPRFHAPRQAVGGGW